MYKECNIQRRKYQGYSLLLDYILFGAFSAPRACLCYKKYRARLRVTREFAKKWYAYFTRSLTRECVKLGRLPRCSQTSREIGYNNCYTSFIIFKFGILCFTRNVDIYKSKKILSEARNTTIRKSAKKRSVLSEDYMKEIEDQRQRQI